MGWLWMCIGLRGKSARRIGGPRVSSDTYLAPQFDPTKTPRIEDYLQPRQAGYDHVFVSGRLPSSPLSKRKCESKDLVSGTHGTRKGTHGGAESIKAECGSYWVYSEDTSVGEDFVSRVTTSGARKSFSELLIETDALEKGPLSLASVAAAAERAARLKFQKDGSNSFEVKKARKAEDNRDAATLIVARDEVSANIASLCKDHLEASNAVAAFKESRRRAQMSERAASTQQQHQQPPATNPPSYISNLFNRSSRKCPLPSRSRPFQTPLSPVPEVFPGAIISGSSIKETSSASANPSSSNSKPSQPHEDWDDYVLVERIMPEPPTEPEAPATTSSVNGRILDQNSNNNAALQDDATSTSAVHTTHSPEVGDVDDELLRTPVRDLLVTPEVFISPKTASAEYNFQRVNDMDPEERPIFGSLADHWEAAWATKRPAWDGRGILNDTNKYSEDQKVMWHAVPFEERLAQALASQEDPVLRRRNSYKTPSSRLSASRSSNRSLHFAGALSSSQPQTI